MWTVIDSPVGPLRLTANGRGLAAIEFTPFSEITFGDQDDDHPVLRATATQLAEYFAGTRTEFDLPLAPVGTDFQLRVWAELRKIGYGQTASYGEIAHRLGLTNAASRAVGLANSRNPIAIVVPCHRVIGADGTLTGYAGGIDRKRALLDLESPALV